MMISFHSGGVVIESRRYLIPGTPLGNLLESTGHGAWRRTGGHTCTLTGTFESRIKDTADTVLLTVTGTYSATPIAV